MRGVGKLSKERVDRSLGWQELCPVDSASPPPEAGEDAQAKDRRDKAETALRRDPVCGMLRLSVGSFGRLEKRRHGGQSNHELRTEVASGVARLGLMGGSPPACGTRLGGLLWDVSVTEEDTLRGPPLIPVRWVTVYHRQWFETETLLARRGARGTL